jgi:hypothetical protein
MLERRDAIAVVRKDRLADAVRREDDEDVVDPGSGSIGLECRAQASLQ